MTRKTRQQNKIDLRRAWGCEVDEVIPKNFKPQRAPTNAEIEVLEDMVGLKLTLKTAQRYMKQAFLSRVEEPERGSDYIHVTDLRDAVEAIKAERQSLVDRLLEHANLEDLQACWDKTQAWKQSSRLHSQSPNSRFNKVVPADFDTTPPRRLKRLSRGTPASRQRRRNHNDPDSSSEGEPNSVRSHRDTVRMNAELINGDEDGFSTDADATRLSEQPSITKTPKFQLKRTRRVVEFSSDSDCQMSEHKTSGGVSINVRKKLTSAAEPNDNKSEAGQMLDIQAKQVTQGSSTTSGLSPCSSSSNSEVFAPLRASEKAHRDVTIKHQDMTWPKNITVYQELEPGDQESWDMGMTNEASATTHC